MVNVGLVVCLSSVAMADAGEYVYHYFDEPRPLHVDPGRLAVKADSEVVAETLATAVDVEPWSIAGWTLARVPDVEQTLAAVAAEPALAFASPVFMGKDGGPVFITPDILVGFKTGVPRAAAEAILAESGAGHVLAADWAGIPGGYRIRSAASSGVDVLAAANALARRPEVLFAEPDMAFTGRGEGFPNDPGFPNCWGLHNTGQSGGTVDADMDAPEAWDVTTGDPTIIVLVIDTGVEQTHPDINQVPGTDTTNEGPGDGGPVNSCDNHGTPVAGCVSAIIDNNLGTVGVAPDCVSASARAFVSSLSCNGSWSSIASYTVLALSWAEDNGVRVTNNSNFYGFESSTIALKYQQTRNDGMVHFAIAGNFSEPEIVYPGSLPSVNAVSALNRFGTLTGFSSWGEGLAFSAPGEDIYSTDRTGAEGYTGGDYVFVLGTSFASPYSAGVAALVLSADDTLSAPDVELIMQVTAVDLGSTGYDELYGWGHVNAEAALAGANCRSATADCDGNGTSDLCELVQGLAVDCNGNVVPDSCDIDDGTSADCNGNTVPDECDPGSDCNTNGTLDECDIASGASEDFNGNTVPDDCECLADLVSPVGQVDTSDFLVLLSVWGPCQPGCLGDLNVDGDVGAADFLYLLGHWGPCP